MEYKSPISNIEWALVISIMAVIDIAEVALAYGLDFFFGIGSVSDAFIDIPVFLTWTSYLFLRAGIKPDWKKVGMTIAGFLGEEADAGGFPLWTLDALAVFALQKIDENAAKFGMIGELAAQAIKQYAESEMGTEIPQVRTPNMPPAPEGDERENAQTQAPSNIIDLQDQFHSPENVVDLRGNIPKNAGAAERLAA